MVVVVLVVVVVVRTRHTALTHQLRILPLRQASPDRGKYLINASYCTVRGGRQERAAR